MGIGEGAAPERDSRTVRVFWIICVPIGIAVVVINPTELGLALGAATILGSIWVLAAWLSRSPKTPPQSLAKPAPQPEPPPPPFRVEDLGVHLDERRRDEEVAENAERDRREQLQVRWASVAPAVAEAVGLVNAQLSRHAMKLVPDGRAPGFRGEEAAPYGFGTTYDLQRDGLPVFDGRHSFVATEKELYVANIGEIELPLDGLTAHRIADATAESVKWFLEG